MYLLKARTIKIQYYNIILISLLYARVISNNEETLCS